MTLIPILIVPAVIAVVGGATLRPVVDRLAAGGGRAGCRAAAATLGAMVLIVGSCVVAIGDDPRPAPRGRRGGRRRGEHGRPPVAHATSSTRAAGSSSSTVAALVGDVVGLAFALLLALLMTFFLLRDGPAWWEALLVRLDAGPSRAGRPAPASAAANLVASYMLGTAAISGFGAVTTGLILVLLGMPLAFPIAVIGFFAGFIPYIGSFISTGLATLVTVAFGTTTDVVVMLIFTVVFNIVQGNILTPLVYGKSLSLHPAIVLMAIPVGNEIAGILGMFLVVPVAARDRGDLAAACRRPSTGPGCRRTSRRSSWPPSRGGRRRRGLPAAERRRTDKPDDIRQDPPVRSSA